MKDKDPAMLDRYGDVRPVLLPGNYDAFLKAAMPVRGSGKNGFRLRYALASLAATGVVSEAAIKQMEDALRFGQAFQSVTFDSFAGIEARVIAIDEFYDWTQRKYSRSVQTRHHKRKPQPNRGPVRKNSW